MTRTVHLVVGPDEHGVVRHGIEVARACGHELRRVDDIDAALDTDLTGADVVHLPFTDRLLADTCEAAAALVGQLAARVHDAGAALSVTLHDVPSGTDRWSQRRRTAYARVMDLARGVVVNSGVELALVQDTPAVHSLRRIDLPVVAGRPVPEAERPAPSGDVTVLGFVFPDRGYEQVLAAMPPGTRLVALGRAAAGHDDLPDALAADAAGRGLGWELTGFVPDDALAARLHAAAVPVAPNRRVTASASIATWITHGRRPLVPDSPYTRELDERMPGALTRYDPDDPAALTAAIARARADPGSTWTAPLVPVGPSWADVGAAYRDHLEACAPPRLRSGADRVLLVPGNRWDLLPARPRTPPSISVVIPYYAAQPALDLVLAALGAQTVAERLEVVVADDGSPEPPDVSAAAGLPVRVVRQPRDGFGAARARNLGAAAAGGELLAFLDGDTLPEPDYLERLLRRPGVHPAVLTVGRRRHADLTGWGPAELTGWLTGRRPGPPVLPEPGWLVDAYRDSADLLHADARSYRFVISAVLGMSRSLFERLGGFDPRFDHYGGEDWELAHRAWQAGALFAHVPAAVAWHDGVDWAARADAGRRREAKNVETLTLSRLLPDPGARGHGQWQPYVHAVVRMPGDDPAAVLHAARSAFASGADCGVWLSGARAVDTAARLGDPRIHAGDVPPDVRARAVVDVDVHRPGDLSALPELCHWAAAGGVVCTPLATATSSRARSAAGHLAGALFGRRDRVEPRLPVGAVDLERDLPRAGQSTRRS